MTAVQEESRDHPGVVAPPPLVFAGFLAAGVLADKYVSGWSLLVHALPAQVLAVVLLGGAGLVFLAGALGLFRRAGTRPEPWQPTSAIVTGGVYRVTPNPMYVGMALVYAAVALAVGSPLAMALLPAAILVVHRGVVLREERYLERKFGDEYVAYRARVRRWL
ncbi:isoprenylcysteine carboxylmethyltransferase family protein [Mesorhizobium sp.]|jgi:protein-S-isoprenylcysteine O-methyltransferase Ste14|uniref:methyltransferase family protein n=1 Tax=Mesorhizobium sp. TaxID=1871066 RepID=UPI001228E883|nr:isoprenylcysteine carboxylmethyltransferase family protein [Mesorhizobium sp.]TIL35420.1 MAG: isoprenylcysteine carboxylmethyltransferase family protein [Mesorhizobium sp.]TIL45655.1 MAG: isoprenylcysteine carboxylmethyltransferase family protein [Mesorhizobium sp.]TIL53015.1 MAG: isoprenylcysteine carboxylmethyltransferase family protein [Mesorhizobium sp.]TIM14719.1 MAG: isoprenylcysteine carboxylmethyltransferase family protein [Mesorhizobium sp.]